MSDRLTTSHKIDNLELGPPVNQGELRLSFINQASGVESADPEINLTVPTFEWRDEAAAYLRDKLARGLLLQCPRHTITISADQKQIQFERLIKLSSGTFDRDSVLAESAPIKELSWINLKAEGFDFEHLYNIGLIPSSLIIKQPYTISSIPDYAKVMLTIGTLTGVIIQLNDAANELAAIVAEAATIFDSVGAVIRAIIRLAYVIFLLLTAIDVFLDVVALLIQRVKYTRGMRINDLIRVACEFIGVLYEPFFDDNECIFPPPRRVPSNPEDRRILGAFAPSQVDNRGFYRGTFADLLRSLMRTRFLRIDPSGGVLRFRPANSLPSAASFTLDGINAVDQQEFKTNASSIVPNVNISYTVDPRDRNTTTNWKGTNVSVTLQMKASEVTDPDAVLFDGKSLKVQIDFARAIPKASLNAIEEIVDLLAEGAEIVINALAAPLNVLSSLINGVIKSFIKVINFVVKFAGGKKLKEPSGIPRLPKLNIGDLIDNRVGMLSLENDDYTIHKITRVSIKSDPRNNKIIGTDPAALLYTRDWREVNQQKYIRPLTNIQMRFGEVLNVRDELALNYKDKVARVSRCEWDAERGGIATVLEVEELRDFVTLDEFIYEPEND